MHQFTGPVDPAIVQQEFELGVACCRARAATIRAQMYHGDDNAVQVWGAMKGALDDNSTSAKLFFIEKFNAWAGQAARPLDVGEVVLIGEHS